MLDVHKWCAVSTVCCVNKWTKIWWRLGFARIICTHSSIFDVRPICMKRFTCDLSLCAVCRVSAHAAVAIHSHDELWKSLKVQISFFSLNIARKVRQEEELCILCLRETSERKIRQLGSPTLFYEKKTKVETHGEGFMRPTSNLTRDERLNKKVTNYRCWNVIWMCKNSCSKHMLIQRNST